MRNAWVTVLGLLLLTVALTGCTDAGDDAGDDPGDGADGAQGTTMDCTTTRYEYASHGTAEDDTCFLRVADGTAQVSVAGRGTGSIQVTIEDRAGSLSWTFQKSFSGSQGEFDEDERPQGSSDRWTVTVDSDGWEGTFSLVVDAS